jgi:hypothetical protein
MNLKLETTRQALSILRPEYDEKNLKQALGTWWLSTRQKENSGLQLSDLGFEALVKAGIQTYRVKFDEPIEMTNQLIIWLDHFIDCPFYLTKKEIFVFAEKMAIQLVLFSGNIKKYGAIKAERQKSA